MTATGAANGPLGRAPAAEPALTGIWLYVVTIALILAPLLQVFDTTIVSIALRQMQGELSATQDQISWVLTTYLVTLSVTTPLWGVLGARFGRKPLILVSIAGFTVFALLSGFSTSLGEIMVWRALQGIFGGALLPIAMSWLLSLYPREDYSTAMSFWGVGMMFGPVFGPTIGGYVAEYHSWRWAFFLNVPVGVLAFLMVALLVPDVGRRPPRKFNYFGFFTLGISIAALQFVLDRGQRLDWLASPEILAAALIGCAAFWLFVVNSLSSTTPFIDPAIFRDPNYLGGTVLRTLFGVLLFGSMVLLPPFIQEIGGYNVMDSGLMMAPRGAGTMAASFFAGYLIRYLDPRKVMGVAMATIALTMWQISTFTEDIDRTALMLNNFIQGLAFGTFMLPLNSVAFTTMAAEQRDAGTAFYALLNNLGRGFGVAVFSSYLAFASQRYQAGLVEHVAPAAETLRHLALPAVWSLSEPEGLAALERTVGRQAKLLAYIADFQLLAISIAACIPVLFFMSNPHKHGKPVTLGGGG
ncbi:MAG: DHA2 family efflux MFS transporter permease subunit [Hyphomicrobiaceae bacterium]|nr:DHA2 family efflux MFS transporter permease subunit [Hyphomicrobiaceae bacterium]